MGGGALGNGAEGEGGGIGGGPVQVVATRSAMEAPAYRNLLGVLAGRELMAPSVAIHLRTSVARAVVKAGCMESSCAAAPATCGAAIEVPLIVLVAVSEVAHAALMPEPGARMSTQRPWFEKYERESDRVVEPTVMASGAAAGV